jgi:phenylalanyl-tRNA synthetase beta chain
MLVSWNWLAEYAKLDMSVAELQRRLMLAGLNQEGASQVNGDTAVDIEVTSNRPDCLGHIGIAREAAVLFGRELKLPAAAPKESATPVAQLTSVTLDAPKLCPRYTARVIRGVKVKPSPDWLVKRLQTVGIVAINNVVDITNYVLMECGQPLHAFDLAKLGGRRIIVREAKPGEPFVAINHKTYNLEPGMCVIADDKRPVALGGVMGGADTEVGPTTTDVLIEAAEFDPISIRNTARRLNLHSDSSYRFERGLDLEGIDWASRRACELILELAGGELAAGVVDVGSKPKPRDPVTLRYAQLKRVLGIEIPPDRVRAILTALGCVPRGEEKSQITVVPPSWRRDLTREIDLVEEVARIHGYDSIPEDVSVPMATSARTTQDRVLTLVRGVLTAAGFDEALTLSVVEEDWSEAFTPWTSAAPLKTSMPVLRRADRLRRSLVPSLLGVRRTNEALANPRCDVFEIATVYLPTNAAGELPDEPLMLGLASGEDYLSVKGAIEAVVARLNPAAVVEVSDFRHELLDTQRACELKIDSERLGFLGEVGAPGRKRFELRGRTTVAEVRVDLLIKIARLVPKAEDLSPYPAVSRDLNLVVDEPVRWADIGRTVQESAGPQLEKLAYQDTYRDAQRLGPGKKSLLFSIELRSREGTLTSEEADGIRDRVVAACAARHGAQLRA